MADHDLAFDAAALLRQADGMADLAAEVASLFRTDLPGMTARLKSAIEMRDPELVVTAAHQLRGALMTIAAGPSRQLAEEVELEARRGTLAGVPERLSLLEQELAKLDAALASFVAGPR